MLCSILIQGALFFKIAGIGISFEMSYRWRPHGLSDFTRFRSGNRWHGGSPTVRKDGGLEAVAGSWSRPVRETRGMFMTRNLDFFFLWFHACYDFCFTACTQRLKLGSQCQR